MTNIINIEDVRTNKKEKELMVEAETQVKMFITNVAKSGLTNEEIAEYYDKFEEWVKLSGIERQKIFDIFAKIPGIITTTTIKE